MYLGLLNLLSGDFAVCCCVRFSFLHLELRSDHMFKNLTGSGNEITPVF